MPDTSKRPLKVFLSHAHSDQHAVRELYFRLKSDGVDAWLDKENMEGGQFFEREIRKAVQESDVVVICLSKEFNQAGFRQREVKWALDAAMNQPEGEIFIIPLRLEECDTLDSLRDLHWVDYFEKDGYERLMRALRLRANKIGAVLQAKKGLLGVLKSPVTQPNIQKPKSPVKIENASNAEETKSVSTRRLARKRKNTQIIVAIIGAAATILAAILGGLPWKDWIIPSPTLAIASSMVAQTPSAVYIATIEPTRESLTPTPSTTQPEGKFFLEPSERITLDNVSKLEKIKDLGYGNVQQIKFSLDGKFFATANKLGVRVFSIDGLKELQYIEVDGAKSIALSPNGDLLAVGSDSGKVEIWQVSNGNVINQLEGGTLGNTLMFTPLGDMLVSFKGEYIQLWDVHSGKATRRLWTEEYNEITALAISPDGQFLADAEGISYGGYTVRVWNLPQGNQMKVMRSGYQISQLEFSLDSKKLIGNRDIWWYIDSLVWNVDTGKTDTSTSYSSLFGVDAIEQPSFSSTPAISEMSPDKKYLVSVHGEALRIWRLSDGSLINEIPWYIINNYSFSQDGSKLAMLYGQKWIEVLDIYSGKVILTIDNLPSSVVDVTFLGNKEIIAVAFIDNTVKFYSLEKNVGDKILSASFPVSAIASSLDGDYIGIVGEYNSGACLLSIFSTEDNNLIQELKTKMASIQFSHDNNFVVRSGTELEFWGIGEESPFFAKYQSDDSWGCDWNIPISQKGVAAIANSVSSQIDIVDIKSGEVIRSLADRFPHNFSPDGNLLLTSNESRLAFWNVNDGSPLETSDIDTGWKLFPALSPDGRFTVILDNGMLRVYGIP